MPNEWWTLPKAHGLSQKDELDFSIKVIKDTGEHSGAITLDCETDYPFVDSVPSHIFGCDARGDCCED